MNEQTKDLPDFSQRLEPISHLLKIFPTRATNRGIKFKCLILEFKANMISPPSIIHHHILHAQPFPVCAGIFVCVLVFSQLPESSFSGHCKPHILGAGTVPSAQLILGGAANPSYRHTAQVGRIKSFPGINIIPEGRRLFPQASLCGGGAM